MPRELTKAAINTCVS